MTKEITTEEMELNEEVMSFISERLQHEIEMAEEMKTLGGNEEYYNKLIERFIEKLAELHEDKEFYKAFNWYEMNPNWSWE